MSRYIFSSFFIIFFFLGCSGVQTNTDYSTREYKNISKDAILNAAKRVVKLSDEDFTISSKRNSISVIRAIPKNKGFTVDININELELNTTTVDTTTVVKLLIKQKDDIFLDNKKILIGNAHDLFWDRVDFILGLKNSWYSCAKYRLLANFDGFFCDIKYNTNKYPTQDDIIKDISIQKIVIAEEANVSPITIDLSSMSGILLPFTNQPEETNVSIADIKPIGLFDLDRNATDIKAAHINEIDTNLTDDNNSNIFNEDLNITILEYIEKPLPDELNNTVAHKNIDILDNNQSIVEILPEAKSMVILHDANNSIPEIANKIEPIQNSKPSEAIILDTNTSDINQTPLESKTSKDTAKSTKPELTGFAKKFMDANPKTDYTINLSLAYTQEQSDAFINKHKLKDATFAIGFTNDSDNKYYIKIMYGIYQTKADALQAIKDFSLELKASKPTVEGVLRKQDLFNKKGKNLSVK